MLDCLKSNLMKAYNANASERDSSQSQEWKIKEREVFTHFSKKENIKTLLEIGAGPGKDSLYFKELGFKTHSIDISPEMVKKCKEKGLNADIMSFDKLDFPDNHFESIWALNCLLHVPKEDMRSVLNEIKRVLKPSGLFYMGVYGGENSEGIWENDHYEPKRFFSFFEDDAMKELVSALFKLEYFNVVPSEVVGGKFNFQSIILRK